MLYYLYWGKAKPAEGGDHCHLLPYHSLDVAAVGWLLLAPEHPLTRRLADELDMSPTNLRRFFVFLLGLHDVGKFSRTFQGLAQPEGVVLVPPIKRLAYTERHDRLGAVLWQSHWMEWWQDGALGRAGELPPRRERRQLAETLRALLAPMFGHHGQPVDAGGLELSEFFKRDDSASDSEAARAFIADWAALIEPDWPVDKMVSQAWREAFLAVSWTVAGWATLSDWLGSNRDHFTYCQEEMPLADYWPIALDRAERALEETGFTQPPEPVPYAGLANWFDGQSITPDPRTCGDKPQSNAAFRGAGPRSPHLRG